MPIKTTISYYRDASPATRRHGLTWYRAAHLWCERAARRHRVPLKTVAAVVAVLSQRVRWRTNLEWTDVALQGGTPPHLVAVQVKVARLMDGDRPEQVLAGPKIVEFYRALMGDMDAVVLDTWMLAAMHHHRGSATPLQNARLAEIVERDAATVGLPPAIYQAIVWCSIRGKAA